VQRLCHSGISVDGRRAVIVAVCDCSRRRDDGGPSVSLD
jgi:hypothetical protein